MIITVIGIYFENFPYCEVTMRKMLNILIQTCCRQRTHQQTRTHNSTAKVGPNCNGTQNDTRSTLVQQQKNDVFCAVLAEILQAG
jgi:hypothetical protein